MSLAHSYRLSNADVAGGWQFVPDTALHLDGLFNGTSALFEAVRSGQQEATRMLLRAGANLLRACCCQQSAGAQRADGGGGSKKKKKKKAAAAEGGEGGETAPRWTTPLHEVVRRGDRQALALVLTNSVGSLQDLCSDTQAPFEKVVLPTDEDELSRLMQEVPVALLDSEGQTPLSLALSSKSSGFALAAGLGLLAAGMQLLQPVRDLEDGTGQSTTHALLLAAKVGVWVESN